jgi:hypothetical protein
MLWRMTLARSRTGSVPSRTPVARPGPSAGRPAVGASLLGLQAAAGNAAVAELVQLARVQRDSAGWEDAKKQGHYWNAGQRTVGAVDRFPLQLASGGFPDEGLDAESAKMTSESARNRAIALVPRGLKPQDPVTVFLHFHGHVEHAGRPYASWREHSASRGITPRPAPGGTTWRGGRSA